MNRTLERLARPAELLLALIFAAGVVLKAMDVNLFAVQIAGYGIIGDTRSLARAALLVLGVESFLALMLVLGPRSRALLYSCVLGLLVLFTALIAYGWAFHDLEDCGCFGPLEMSPGLSISKNLVMMVLAVAAWRGFAGRSTPGRLRADLLSKATVAGIVSLGLVVGVSTTVESVESNAPRPFAQFSIATDMGLFELGTGEYLVALLSMGCDHCKASVPTLNAMLYYPELPPLVALCYEEFEGQIDEFRALTQPEFPMHNLGTQTLLFFELLGEAGEPPRLVYTRDGAEVLSWKEEVPAPDIIAAAIQSSGGN